MYGLRTVTFSQRFKSHLPGLQSRCFQVLWLPNHKQLKKCKKNLPVLKQIYFLIFTGCHLARRYCKTAESAAKSTFLSETNRCWNLKMTRVKILTTLKKRFSYHSRFEKLFSHLLTDDSRSLPSDGIWNEGVLSKESSFVRFIQFCTSKMANMLKAYAFVAFMIYRKLIKL